MSESQKFPFIHAMMNIVHSSNEDAAALRGRALPCHVVSADGPIVTVQFDILPGGVQFPEITIPVAGFEYVRYPIQPGDKGVTIPADLSLRGVSGLGVGMADGALPPSMTALFFMPLGNKNWQSEDPNKVTVYGPEGVMIKTKDGASSITVEPGKITEQADAIHMEAKNIYLKGIIHLNGTIVQDESEMGEATTATFIGPMNVTNDVVGGGVSLKNHPHDVKNVQGGESTIQSEKPKAG
ncbi:phage baseplate protein [Citrobacter werkmanii]|uniref:phage baseplate protein n=1 Tax=Citrobacter werkmanii TaxID=67827 RepID=UPI00300C6495